MAPVSEAAIVDKNKKDGDRAYRNYLCLLAERQLFGGLLEENGNGRLATLGLRHSPKVTHLCSAE